MKIGFFKKILLKLITKLQEISIKSNNTDFYLMLTGLHFKMYFKKDLIEEALDDSKEFNMAANRHANMVMVKVYDRKNKNLDNNLLYEMAKKTFKKNLLLKMNI